MSDLGELRVEYELLSSRMNRVAILTFSVVLLLVLGLTNAFRQVAESKDYRKLQQLREDVRGTFQLDVAVEEENAEVARLRALVASTATKAYTREVSVLGVSIDVDLRRALVLLPAILLVSALYALLLWFKREAVQRIGEHLLASAPDAAVAVDRLYFARRDAPYAENPGRLGWWCYLGGMAALLFVLRDITREIWSAWQLYLTWTYLTTAALVATCAFAYALAAGAAIDDQAATLTGRLPEGGLTRRATVRLRSWSERVASRLRYRRILGLSASTVMLLSLLAPTALPCTGDEIQPIKGIELLATPAQGIWLTSALFSMVRQALGLAAFAAGLWLAAISLIVFAVWFRRRVPSRITGVARAAAGIVAAYVVVDTGFFLPLWMLTEAGDLILPVTGDSAGYVMLESLPPLFLLVTIVAFLRRRRPTWSRFLHRWAAAFALVIPAATVALIVIACHGSYGYSMWAAGLVALAVAWSATHSSEAVSAATSDR
ncbi:MAG TPA: hypothetical protein VEU30_09895 [Thermoanaerobaculia bacterium]|nr:hypothetical protein [Thermoanaerobaculia bacterium]